MTDPDPGTHWVLLASGKSSVLLSGTVRKIDSDFVFLENRPSPVTQKLQRNKVLAILFYPPVKKNASQKYVRNLLQRFPEKDELHLINGDTASGRLVTFSGQTVSFQIADSPVSIPLYRLRAVRMKSVAGDL